MRPNPIRVLVVDDSLVVRQTVKRWLSQEPDIQVVGTAADPYEAKEQILALKPEVITLDLEMPKMDGLTFLKILMEQHPLPVIIFSSLSQSGSQIALDALALGAVDVLGKPTGSQSVGLVGPVLAEKIRAAAHVRPGLGHRAAAVSAPVVRPSRHARNLILLGASTGGTEALKAVLTQLPAGLPPILIVQHMPPVFTKAFAERLNSLCAFRVREAVDGDKVEPGTALLAPGDFHMVLAGSGMNLQVRLTQGPPVWYQRPAVDMLFTSAAPIAGAQSVAAILTGMGRDGAEGLLRLRRAGAATLAQSEETCVVYGMPRAAHELGAAERMVPLPQIARTLCSLIDTPATPARAAVS